MKPDIRASIVKAMTAAGWNANQLAAAVEGKVSRSQVYDYLSGASDLGTDKANHLLAALGLKLIHATSSRAG